MSVVVLLLTLALLSLGESVGPANPSWGNSFKAPFDDFRNDGKRTVEDWNYGGVTTVKENFIRLTPDRQSKAGWMFNKNELKFRDWTALFRFRISGQGKNLFGDGIALWVTQSKRFESGYFFGASEQFTGFGILFDTFRNSESGHVHKDISVVVNNGDAERHELEGERPGCMSAYRYHEGRDDFSVVSESQARVSLVGSHLSVQVDARATGDWKDCFDVDLKEEKFGLPMSFKSGAHVSISASTGALADNHDVLEFTVTKPEHFDKYLEEEEEDAMAPQVEVEVHEDVHPAEVAEGVNELAVHVKDIETRLTTQGHHMEHQLESVTQGLKKTITKLQEREEGAEDRIKVLEEEAKKTLDKTITNRVINLEKMINTKVEQRLAKLEKALQSQIDSVESAAGGWFWPLIVLVLCVVGFVAWTQRSMKKLRDRDKLF